MNPSRTLSTAPLEHPAMDYALLREAGIRRLERMAGRLWTDFNAHDPGITILEQLCYALTDLGYRIDYDLKDLLADGTADPYRALYSPAEILTTNPVTLADLRKVVIDVDGVKNAWIEPVELPSPPLYYDAAEQTLSLEEAPSRAPVALRGVYRVLLEADGSQYDAAVVRAVRARLQACRNLADVFEPPTMLTPLPITVTAQVEVGAIDDPNRLLAEIYHALARFISPTIRRYTLPEMLARGRSIDEIMDGPALSHGFIDNEELERFQRPRGLRASDLIHELMRVPGVAAVDDVALSDGVLSDPWYLNLRQARSVSSTPVLNVDALFAPTPPLRLVRSGSIVPVDPRRVRALYDALLQADRFPPLPDAQRDVRLPPGRERHVGRYRSIQHQFPATYGIGELGLPDAAPPLRQAQARQLKAYLLFFDQLLANYFAQLAHAKELFAFDAPEPRTYFAQLIDDAALGLDEIWVDDAAARATRLDTLVADHAPGEQDAARKNRFLNHLLARFAEEFTDYALHEFAAGAPAELVAAKSAFLRDYRELGAARSRGFDATLPVWDTDNVSGLEKRISRKLGLADYRRRDLAGLGASDAGGFHMLEPILLRPQPADLAQWTQPPDAVGWLAPTLLGLPQATSGPPRIDPFSLRLCFVFPAWIRRFERDFVRRIVRDEAPAHLDVQLQWLSKAEMTAFEAAFRDWLTSSQAEERAAQDQSASVLTRAARDRLIDLLRIGDPYPLRDLELRYMSVVALDHPTDIEIVGGQIGVTYQLADDDGNPLVAGDDAPYAATRTEGLAGDTVVLHTPPITKDISYTVLATRAADAYGTPLPVPLETYLTTRVSIKAGINRFLALVPQPDGRQVAAGAQITIEYGDTLKVAVAASQEGISYALVKRDTERLLSRPVVGSNDTIVLETTERFTEDVELQVVAYRTAERTNSAVLAGVVAVLVRPDRAVALAVEPATPPVVDYAAPATLTLRGAQTSAEYGLYARPLLPADYLAAGGQTISTGADSQVYIRAPEPVADWDDPAGYTFVGAFVRAGADASITVDGLTDDQRWLVLATKTANRERVQLDQSAVVLVRPDPRPEVDVEARAVLAGAEGTVLVSGTQQGVAYQLRLNADDTPVGAPGYDYRDRAVETARLEVDFVVEEPADARASQTLRLPAGSITSRTVFNVLATKILTGLTAELRGKATIVTQRGSAPPDEGV